jgi:hypothetical protein
VKVFRIKAQIRSEPKIEPLAALYRKGGTPAKYFRQQAR